MATEVIVAIVASLTTVLVAIGGWVFAWTLNRDTKRLATLERRNQELVDEVRARMHMEDVAVSWIAESEGLTEAQAKLQLRERGEKLYGSRPRMSPSQIDRYDEES